MPCRVGITTDPKTREVYWESQVVGLTDWRLLKRFGTKTNAQEYETGFAKVHGCQQHQGGSGPERATWYVYHFEYTRIKSK